MATIHMTKIGKASYFPWKERLQKNEWPGRELFWVWCHPILSFVLFVTLILTLLLYFSGA